MTAARRARLDFSAHARPFAGGMVFSGPTATATARSPARRSTPSSWRTPTARASSSLSDLQEALTPPPRAGAPGAPAGPQGTLIQGLFRQEIGSLQAGPALGERPDFTLKTVDGKEEVTLSKQVGPKPVVLVFGNFTCGPFRSQAGNVEKLYRRYKDRATFLMVYVREAHPSDGWRMESNDRVDVRSSSPTTIERIRWPRHAANGSTRHADARGHDRRHRRHRYSGIPSRLYLIDQLRQGRLQERPRPVRLQAGRAGAFAHSAVAGRIRRPEGQGFLGGLIPEAGWFTLHTNRSSRIDGALDRTGRPPLIRDTPGEDP